MSSLREYLTAIAEMQQKVHKANRVLLDGQDNPMGRAYRFIGLEQAVLLHGKEYAPQELTTGERKLAEAVRWNAAPRYSECFRVASCAEHIGVKSAVYVEGIATTGILPVHHAWFTLNGKVVDLTWRRDKNGKTNAHGQQFVYGTWPSGWGYIGIEIPWRFVLLTQMRTGKYASVLETLSRAEFAELVAGGSGSG